MTRRDTMESQAEELSPARQLGRQSVAISEEGLRQIDNSKALLMAIGRRVPLSEKSGG